MVAQWGFVRISDNVVGTGMGIKPRNREFIFKPFLSEQRKGFARHLYLY